VACRSDVEDPVLDACLLHCINHCSKTAELIKKTNQQAKADPDFEAPRDQGFTRPKVQLWMLLPQVICSYLWLACPWWSQVLLVFTILWLRPFELWSRQQACGTCPALLWGLQTSCLHATRINCPLCKHCLDDQSCWALVPCISFLVPFLEFCESLLHKRHASITNKV